MESGRVEGTCDAAFSKVREVFESSFENGEVGASVAVYVDGEPAVNLWGGWADEARTLPWQQDTIVNTFSTTKGMTSVCAHRLLERGLLDIDSPVAAYWPEFAQAGKENITVRHVLTHQAGMPSSPRLSPGERYDLDKIANALAAQAPEWEPGTKSAYHALNFGFLVGELVRRVDGRTLGTYFREEVADPLKADFMIGFGPEHDDRCAEVLLPRSGPDGTRSPTAEANARMGMGTNTREWRAAEIPAANGHGTADGVARVYAALARGGELDGVQVLRPETIAAATVRQRPSGAGDGEAAPPPARDQLTRRGPSGITGLPFALGFMLTGDFLRMRAGGQDVPGATMFGHPGAGGSSGAADPAVKVGFGYVMNQMQAGMVGGSHGFNLLFALYDCLK